jgi:glycosyl transferase family 25
MTVFAGFDRIRIINLPSRPDRRKEMENELRRIGLDGDPRVEFVDGVVVEEKSPFRAVGEKGVFLAQLKIISEAAAAGESVLILEDDVDFTPAAANWVRPVDCDIAYGGYEGIKPQRFAGSNIIGGIAWVSAPAPRRR